MSASFSLHRHCVPARTARWTAVAALSTVAALLVGPTTGSAQSSAPLILRPLADAADITFGAAADVETLGDTSYRQLLSDHVNLVSTRGDLSMAAVQPQQGSFDFTATEAVVDFAAENDLPVRVHQLVDGAVPGWVSGASWTAETLGGVLRDHVTAVIAHFRDRNPGVVTQWDVVGDAFLPDGSRRPTIWQQVIGDDHLRIAFDAARAADPDAVLFYDDFYDDLSVTQDAVETGVPIAPGANAERTTCDAVQKCVGVRDSMAALLDAGAPIDGIGVQGHLFSPDPADLSQLTSWIGELDMVWAVTEFDVPLPVTEIDAPDGLSFQANVYADALAACADSAACDTFVTSGISDRFSPIPDETGGAFGGALWFDSNDVAKPAFDALAGVLAARAASTTASTPIATAPATSEIDVAAPSTSSTSSDVEPADGDGPLAAILIGVVVLGAIVTVILISRRRDSRSPDRRTKHPRSV
jgi:endo-1,4-beta-xylanase